MKWLSGILFMAIMSPAWGAMPQAPWMTYFGNHYDTTVPWGLSARDPGGPGRFGYWTPSTRNKQRMTTADSGMLEELIPLMARGEVVLSVGGVGSGRDMDLVAGFLDEVRKDGATTWKKELSARVRRVAQLPGASEKIYWQFGNEINGPRILRNLAQWGGISASDKADTLRQIIPVYVEYFLAPGAEAIRTTSRELHGDPEKIRIMLGSLANARNPDSIRWYEQLLDYTIKGDYAPSLSGRKVHEIVDTLSIHYLVTAQDEDWSDMLDGFAGRWVGRGAVRRIWSTEELGVRRAKAGQGASTALRVTARYLDWWQRHGWTPERGHCFFWGSEMGSTGTRATDALRELYEFTGPAALERLPGATAGGLENYLFDVAGGRKRVLIAFPRDKWLGGGATLDVAHMPASGWSGDIKAQVLHYSPEGVRRISATVTGNASTGYRIVPQQAVDVDKGAAIMILIER